MALISVAKLLLIIAGTTTLLFTRSVHSLNPSGTLDQLDLLRNRHTPTAVLFSFFALAISLLWTVAPEAQALGSVAKYGKLIVIILMLLLIRSQREAMCVLAAFALAQLFLLTSSWMLAAHWPVPWATSNMALKEYSVFSSYLDQGIMSAVFAALCWHFRELVPGRWGQYWAILGALAALGNVFFVLSGRSGHMVAIGLISIAIMWELPKRYRAAVILLPFVLALGLYASSTKVRDRLSQVNAEMQTYSSHEEPSTSSGIRLHFWYRAGQLIAERPLTGWGAGSWSTEYNRLQFEQNPKHIPIAANGNPHQEYLLWGVQLGIPGMLIFLGLLLCILRDTLTMATCYARATQSTLLALAVACLFNASLYDAQIGDFFCVLIGLLLALGLTPNTANAPNHPQHEPSA